MQSLRRMPRRATTHHHRWEARAALRQPQQTKGTKMPLRLFRAILGIWQRCQWRSKPAAAAEACNARVSCRHSFEWRILRRQCETQRLVTRLYGSRVERPRRRHVVAIEQCDGHTHHSNRAQLLGPVAKWFSSMGLSLQHPRTRQWSGLSPQRATTEAQRCAALAALGTLETPGRTHREFTSQLVGPDSRAAKIDFQMALRVARLALAEMEVAKASHCTGTNAQVGASGTRPLQQAQIRHISHCRWQAETHPVRYTEIALCTRPHSRWKRIAPGR